MSTSLQVARSLVKGDKSEALDLMAKPFSDGSAKSPSDLLTMDDPKSGHLGRAYGAYLVFKYSLKGEEVKAIVKKLSVIGKKFDKIDFSVSKEAMFAHLGKLTAEYEQDIARAKQVKENDGTALKQKLISLDNAISAIESGVISPTQDQRIAYEALVTRINALRGSFGSVRQPIQVVSPQEEPVLVAK